MVARWETPGAQKSIREVFEMAKYHVGVDVSKRKHKACIRSLSQDFYSGVFSFKVNRQRFEKFLATLEKSSQNKEGFVIGIETTGN
jgi:transposase